MIVAGDTLEGGQHPDRDAQFRYINDQVKDYQASGEPVISVDTKKREQLFRLPMAGRGTVKLTLIMIFLALVGARCGRHSSQIVDILWLLQQS